MDFNIRKTTIWMNIFLVFILIISSLLSSSMALVSAKSLPTTRSNDNIEGVNVGGAILPWKEKKINLDGLEWDVPIKAPKIKQPKMDILYLVDKSGSMDSGIQQVKGTLQEFTNELNINGASDIQVAASGVDGNVPWGELSEPTPTFHSINNPDWSGLDTTKPPFNGFEAGGNGIVKKINSVQWRPGAKHQVVLIADTSIGNADSTTGMGTSPDEDIEAYGDKIYAALQKQSAQVSLMLLPRAFTSENIGFIPWADGYKSWKRLASLTNSKVYLESNDNWTNLKDNLTKSVLEPLPEEEGTHTYSAKVIKSVYDDGTPSNDILATTSDAVTISGGDMKKIHLTAKPKANLATNARTTVTYQFYKDGQPIEGAIQKVSYGKGIGQVKIHYVDTNGNKIADDTILSGKDGDPFELKAKSIAGYHVVSSPDPSDNVFNDSIKELTFKYQVNKGGNVYVMYQDKNDGNSIADMITKTGNFGDNFTLDAKDIKNYHLVDKPKISNGKFTDEEQKFIYWYDLNDGADVTVRYVDTQGNSLAENTVLKGKVTKDYTSSPKQITDYVLTKTPANAHGKFTDQKQTVTYVYDRAAGKQVIINYHDQNGKELMPADVQTGKIGEDFSLKDKEIPDYHIVKKPSVTSGKFTNAEQKFEYIYEKNDGAPVTVKYVDKNGNSIAKDTSLQGKIHDNYQSKPIDIPGYVLVSGSQDVSGKYTYEKQTVTYVYDHAPAKPVTIQYVDTNGNEIAKSETINGKITEEYTTKAKDITNYILAKTPENAHGKFTDQKQTVTYVYDKAPGKAVVTKYLDNNGREIAPSHTQTGKIGDSFTVNPLSIPDYHLIKNPENQTGQFSNQTQEFIYQYELNDGAAVTVQYVDANNQKVAEDIVLNGKIHSNYESKAKNIGNYVLTQVPKNATGKFTYDKQTVTYVYDRAMGANVTSHYYDKNGKELIPPTVQTGKIGDSFNLKAPDIPDYHVIKKPDTLSGTFTDKAQDFNWNYELNDGAEITVKYVNTKGQEIAPSETLTGKIHSAYHTDAKKVTDYQLIKTPTNATGKFTYDKQTITYLYEPAEAKAATIQYLDKNGKEIAPAQEKTGKIGDNFEFTGIEIPHYHLIDDSNSIKGSLTNKPQKFVFHYALNNGANVIVHHVDTNNHKIAPDNIIKGAVTTNYETAPVDIKGYHLKTIPINAHGQFSDKEQNVTYIYESTKVNLKVSYQDENGQTLKNNDIYHYQAFDKYTVKIPQIKGYVFKNTKDKQALSGTIKDNMTVILIYHKLPSNNNIPINSDSTTDSGLSQSKPQPNNLPASLPGRQEGQKQTSEVQINPGQGSQSQAEHVNTPDNKPEPLENPTNLPATGKRNTLIACITGLLLVAIIATFYQFYKKHN